MQAAAQTTAPIDWDFIIETIKAEKCILFLGPGIFSANSGGPTLEDALIEHLNPAENTDIQAYYKQDHLFLFNSRARKTKTFYKIKSFYDNPFPEADDILGKIAEIPFHFIMNVTPDKLISRAFNKRNIRHKFHFYWKKMAPDEDIKVPNANNPTVYNMLGCIDRQESMVLTHTDLFEFFESVFAGNSLPERYKRLIKEANNFIFLGIPFERWYMQLLMRILYLHNDFDFVRYASNQSINEEVRSFCFEQFKIEFVPTHIHEFINSLHAKCAESSILRALEEEAESPIEHLMELLGEDEVEEVLNLLRDHLTDAGESGEELLDDVLLMMNKYSRLSKRIVQGIIAKDEADLQSNKIRVELLELLREADGVI